MPAHTSSDHGDCLSEHKGLQLRNGKKRYEQLDANVNKLHEHQLQQEQQRQQQQQQQQEPQEAPPSDHRTLRAEEVDFVFREPFILTGYRLPSQPWRYYLASVLWLHNETLNVWTHAIGCVLVLARTLLLVWQLGGLGAPRAWPVLGFALGCCLNNLLSSSAHLLHSRSPRHHYVLYILDYAGITFYSLANGVGAMYSCSHPAVFERMEPFFLPAIVVLAWLSFLACVLARLRYKGHVEIERKLVMVSVFGALAVFVSWPMVERYTDCVRDEGCSLASLNHITLVFVFFALDGLLYAAHVPERWWPGRFDLWGHGHQWFHVCVIVTQQWQLHALHVDLVQLGRGGHAVVDLPSLLLAFVALAVIEAVTLRLFNRAIDSKVSLASDTDEKTQ